MTPETALKKAIKQYLMLNNWFTFHILQGLGSYKGACDLIAIKKGRVLFIEVKTPGGVQSDFQKTFEKNLKGNGGHYLVARDLYDIERYIMNNFDEQSLLFAR